MTLFYLQINACFVYKYGIVLFTIMFCFIYLCGACVVYMFEVVLFTRHVLLDFVEQVLITFVELV
jgi:hypothetical protein